MIIKFNELNELDKRFIELAQYAAQWSPDPKTKVGSVIVDQYNNVRAVDCNHFPRGVCENSDRLNNKEEKLKYISHAERNALDGCDQSLRNNTVYVTLQPCIECTKSIIQRGIAKIVCCIDVSKLKYYRDFINYSLPMMQEAGVEVIQIHSNSSGDINVVSNVS